MKKLSFWRGAALAVLLVGALQFAVAADVNARIKGIVTDPQGSALPGIKVTATNDATGVKFDTTTGADGGYYFPQLPVGTYTVSVAATGFKGFTATGIALNIDQEYVEAIKLTVGSTAEVVEVAASPVQVNTSDMELSNVVNSEQIVELPLIGRNFTGLELTLPGVQASSDRFGSFSVSGGQTQQSSFLINGADANDIALNTLVVTPNLDAIDQFNLIDGPLNAEYDRNSGGIVSATIKEGTNHFHGDGFEFYRDTFLNTANFYQHNIATGAPVVATFHQNIFGGTVGGPVVHDKLFFFGAYQGTRQVVPEAGGSVGVYQAQMLNGDFSSDLGSFLPNPIPSSVTIPGCSTPGETWDTCAAALGGVFPTTSFNSLAASLAKKYVPAPNSGTSYLFKPVVTTTNNQYIGRVDYSLNPANQVYGLFIIFKQKAPETLPFTGASLPGFGDVSSQSTNMITVDYVHQFSSSAVNDFAAHYTRFNFDAVEPQTPATPASVGFGISAQNSKGAGLPLLGVSGLNGVGFTLGFSTNGPQPRIDQVIQLDDGFSKNIGRHTLKFGYDGRRFNVSNPFSANNNGSYSFNGASGSPYTTGDGALDYLLGIPSSYAQGSGSVIQADAFLNYLFAQDSYKITPSFTLSYGLGYSIDTPLHNNQFGGKAIVCLNPGVESKVFTNAPLGVAYPGDGACNNAGLAKTRYSELGPRLGFAWAPDLGAISGQPGKFSIRGGFGIYYDRTEEESSLQTLQTPPYGITSFGASDFGGSPSFVNPFADINGGGTISNKFPYAFPKAGAIPASTWALVEPFDISTYDSSFRAPYAENFQLSVERELPSRVVARVSYVGSLGRHNQVTYEGNSETPAGHAACLAGNEFSPYLGATVSCSTNRNNQVLFFPQNQKLGAADAANMGIDPNTGITGVASFATVGSYASSSYHSLQASVEKAPTHGLLFQLSYTYSHALDTGSSFENSGFGSSGQRGWNQYQQSLNYGDSLFDARHRVVFSPVYRIPQFGGSSLSLKNMAIAGWEISGISTLATGFPFDISYAGGTSRSLYCSANWYFYVCPDVPQQVAPLTFGNKRTRVPAGNSGAGNSVYLTNALSTGAAGVGAKTKIPGFTSGAAALQPEPLGSFGNVRRNPLHGPGINNTNLILAKNFMLVPERNISIQLRMESDNVFNHTQFSNPTSGVTSSSLGIISSAAAARQTQLAAKFYF